MCKFCELLQKYQELDSYYKKKHPEDQMEEEYSAALVSTDVVRGHRRGSSTHYGYALNFCPECGKDLRENKTDKVENSAIDPILESL